jgi:hypothetical protein
MAFRFTPVPVTYFGTDTLPLGTEYGVQTFLHTVLPASLVLSQFSVQGAVKWTGQGAALITISDCRTEHKGGN